MALRKVGALWLKEGQNGKFMSGVFEPDGREGVKYDILVFKNNKREGKRDPDYQIQMREEDGDARVPPSHAKAEEFQATDEDVPFGLLLAPLAGLVLTALQFA